ncbi:MAG: methyltransferase domain-containing protein [Cyclobacteriaceae bacterium]|nr:methyltransferase domain-containing protein [Cyclobacteriaceae bacterium]
MPVYTTEIASDVLGSDNPIHQRLLKPYYLSIGYVSGDILEIGCGQGRGVELLLSRSRTYTGIDKITEVVNSLKARFPKGDFRQAVIPPLAGLADNSFDFVVSFQVIEHIKDDDLFMREIHRVLKPGGKALLTTPNRKLSLSRNPWHIREYTSEELKSLAGKYFQSTEMMGIAGNKKVMDYHDQNRASVNKLMRWDFLNLQYRLPAFLLKIPYEIMNRWNRGHLQKSNSSLVDEIRYDDYILSANPDTSLDLFLIAQK